MNTIQIEDYNALIYKQAHICLSKIKDISCLTVEDLAQEGAMCFYNVVNKYDKSKGKFSTFLTTVLKNHYSKLVLYEYKNKYILVPDIVNVYDTTNKWEAEVDFIEESFSEALSDTAFKIATVISKSNNTKNKLKLEIKEDLGITTKELTQGYRELARKMK